MSTTQRKKTAELLWDFSVRIESIIWLAAVSDAPPEALMEFLRGNDEDAKRLFGKEPPENEGEFEEYLTDLFNANISGYLVQAATPKQEKGQTWYSWSYYQTEWFYFETWDEEAVAKALEAFAERVRPEVHAA